MWPDRVCPPTVARLSPARRSRHRWLPFRRVEMMTASTAAFRRSGVIRIASADSQREVQQMTVRWCLTPEPGFKPLKWTVPRSPSSDDVTFYLRPPHDYEVQFLLGIGSSRK